MSHEDESGMVPGSRRDRGSAVDEATAGMEDALKELEKALADFDQQSFLDFKRYCEFHKTEKTVNPLILELGFAVMMMTSPAYHHPDSKSWEVVRRLCDVSYKDFCNKLKRCHVLDDGHWHEHMSSLRPMLARPDFTPKRLAHVIGGAGKLCRWVITCLAFQHANLKETEAKTAEWRESSESTNEIKTHIRASAEIVESAQALVIELGSTTADMHSKTVALNRDFDSLVNTTGLSADLKRAELTVSKLVQLLAS